MTKFKPGNRVRFRHTGFMGTVKAPQPGHQDDPWNRVWVHADGTNVTAYFAVGDLELIPAWFEALEWVDGPPQPKDQFLFSSNVPPMVLQVNTGWGGNSYIIVGHANTCGGQCSCCEDQTTNASIMRHAHLTIPGF